MKHAVRLGILALLIASLATLTGCWNYQELEDRYTVDGIAIDKGKQGHRYHLTFEVIDLAKGNGQTVDVKAKQFEIEGDTIADAVSNISKSVDKELYYSDCKVIIFSKQIAQEGLTPVLDWLNRDPRPRFSVQMFVSQEDTAGELLEPEEKTGGQQSSQSGGQQSSQSGGQQSSQSGGQQSSQSGGQQSSQSGGQQSSQSGGQQSSQSDGEQGGQSDGQQGGQSVGMISTQIADSMEAVSTGGRSRQMHLNDVDNVLLGEGEDLTLPCLRKSGKKNPQVEVNGTAVFRGDKYAGFMNDDQTQDFLLFTNNFKKSILLVGEKPEEKRMALIVRESSVALAPEISGETIKMKVKMKMQCSFDEENSEKNYLLKLGVKKVEGLADRTLQERLRETVRQVQTEFGCDIFGFGRKIYQEDPKEWEKLKSSWREKFRTVSVEAEADASIIDTEFTQPKGST